MECTSVSSVEACHSHSLRTATSTGLVADGELVVPRGHGPVYFAIEQPLLMPLPQEPFETGRLFTPRVRPLQPDRRPDQPLLGPRPV
jgi:hypothetical protein